MKEYLKRVRECVKDLNLFAELTQEIETKFSKEESLEFGVSVLAAAKEILNENSIPEVLSFLVAPEDYKGEMKIEGSEENINLCVELQEKVTEICGDWTEESAAIMLASFVLNGGIIEGVDTEKFVTYGVLFGLKEDNENAKKESPITLAKYKEFPEDNKLPTPGLAILGFKLQEEKDINLISKYDLFFETNEDDKTHTIKGTIFGSVVDSQVFELITQEGYSEETLKTVVEAHELTEEVVTSIKARAEFLSTLNEKTDEELFAMESIPSFVTLSLDIKEAVSSFLYAKPESYLLELVSVLRDNKLTKEDLNKSVSKYKVFSKKALEKLLNSIPESKVEETKEEKPKVKEESEEISQELHVTEGKKSESNPSTNNRLLEYYDGLN